MAAKIIRKKRLFEDDANNQPQVLTTTPQPAPTLTLQTQPVAATTTDTTQQLQVQPQQLVLLLNTTQPASNLQQPQDLTTNQTQQIVVDIMKQMQNTYWCIANNIPEIIKEKLSDFKPENELAKPIIALWDSFKKDPNENTFNAFIDGFKTFGTTPPANNQTDNQQISQNNVSASISYNFKSALHENLNSAIYAQKLSETFKNYL